MRATLLALLVSCAVTGEPVAYEYDCRLVFACGETGHYDHVPFLGTVDEVREQVDDWLRACSVITSSYVTQGACSSTLCAALCSEKETR